MDATTPDASELLTAPGGDAEAVESAESGERVTDPGTAVVADANPDADDQVGLAAPGGDESAEVAEGADSTPGGDAEPAEPVEPRAAEVADAPAAAGAPSGQAAPGGDETAEVAEVSDIAPGGDVEAFEPRDAEVAAAPAAAGAPCDRTAPGLGENAEGAQGADCAPGGDAELVAPFESGDAIVKPGGPVAVDADPIAAAQVGPASDDGDESTAVAVAAPASDGSGMVESSGLSAARDAAAGATAPTEAGGSPRSATVEGSTEDDTRDVTGEPLTAEATDAISVRVAGSAAEAGGPGGEDARAATSDALGMGENRADPTGTSAPAPGIAPAADVAPAADETSGADTATTTVPNSSAPTRDALGTVDPSESVPGATLGAPAVLDDEAGLPPVDETPTVDLSAAFAQPADPAPAPRINPDAIAAGNLGRPDRTSRLASAWAERPDRDVADKALFGEEAGSARDTLADAAAAVVPATPESVSRETLLEERPVRDIPRIQLPAAERSAGGAGDLADEAPTASRPAPAPAPARHSAARSTTDRELPAPRRTRLLTVANQKGGVGKTTTTVNIAAALAQAGLSVLVLDLDPQGNASTALGIPHHAEVSSVYDVLVDGMPLADVVQECPDIPGLLCAPATIDLAGAEIELVSLVARELRLGRALTAYLRQREDAGQRIDYVLIDCPPSLGLLTINAFVAAEEVFIPIQCEYYALEGLSQLLKNIELIKAHLNPMLHVSTILLTMFDGRTRLSSQVADEVRRHFGPQVIRSMVPRSVRISEAPSHGQTVITYDPTSSGALSYTAAAAEIAEAGASQEGATR